MSRAARVATLIAVVFLATSCSKSAEQYFESGNRYFKNKQFKEASVQYRNAVNKNQRWGQARLKLAESYEATGDLVNAFFEYIKAADLLPANIQVQLKAATMCLAAQRFDDAKRLANKAKEIDPKNVDAQIILGRAALGLKDIDDAIKQVREATEVAPSEGRAYVELGGLQTIKGGSKGDAEASFKKAAELDPKSVAARVALSILYAASPERRAEAERELKTALQLDPTNVSANNWAAYYYIAIGKPKDAEPYLRKVAETTKSPEATITLADYYVQTNRANEAISVLQSIAGQKGWSGAARSRIAAIKYAYGQQAEAHTIIDDVIKQEPRNSDALLYKARFLYKEKKLDEALKKAQAAADADPRSAVARSLVGDIYAAQNKLDEAIAAFTEVLKLNPRATNAQIQISQLQLAKGEFKPAVQFAEDAVQSDPNNGLAHAALARSLLANGQVDRATVDRAEQELQGLVKGNPERPDVHAMMGAALAIKGDLAGARKSYERALQLAPDNFEAVAGLTDLDVRAKKHADARARVDARLASSPADPRLLVLSGSLYAAVGDTARAEQTLQRALDTDPANLQAYAVLAGVYIQQRPQKLEEARAKYEELARRQPKAVGPPTLVGMILEMQDKTAEAEKQYQKVLAIDGRAPVAANNLAYLYAQSGKNLDVALQLAQTAKEQLPKSPEVDDTLGWVYYKKGLTNLAVPAFQSAVQLAAAAQRDASDYHYHLGLAYKDAGDKVKARESLERALKANQYFAGAGDARKILDSLK